MALTGKGYWVETPIAGDPAQVEMASGWALVCTNGTAGTDRFGNAFDYASVDLWAADAAAYTGDGSNDHTDRNGVTKNIATYPARWCECYGAVDWTGNLILDFTNTTNNDFSRIYAAPREWINGKRYDSGWPGAYVVGVVQDAVYVDHMRIHGMWFIGTTDRAIWIGDSRHGTVWWEYNVFQLDTTDATHAFAYQVSTPGTSTPGIYTGTTYFRNNIVYAKTTAVGDVGILMGVVLKITCEGDNSTITSNARIDNDTFIFDYLGAGAGEQGPLFNIISCPVGSDNNTARIGGYRRNNMILMRLDPGQLGDTNCIFDRIVDFGAGNDVAYDWIEDDYNIVTDDTDNGANSLGADDGITWDGCVRAIDDATPIAHYQGDDLSDEFTRDALGRVRRLWSVGALEVQPSGRMMVGSQQLAGSESVSILVFLQDEVTDESRIGLTVADPTDLDIDYCRVGEADVGPVDLAQLATPASDWEANHAVEVDAVNFPGLYRIDLPNAALAAGAGEVIIRIWDAVSGTITPYVEKISLTTFAVAGSPMTLTAAERTVTAGVIDTLLTTSHGSGNWTSWTGVIGPGSTPLTVYTDNADTGVPLDGVEVWVSTDEAGAHVIAGTLHSDSTGNCTFLLNAGTAAEPNVYYVWRAKGGFNFDALNPERVTLP